MKVSFAIASASLLFAAGNVYAQLPTEQSAATAQTQVAEPLREATTARMASRMTSWDEISMAPGQAAMPQTIPAPVPDTNSTGPGGGAPGGGSIAGGVDGSSDVGGGGCGPGGNYPYGPRNRTPLVRRWYVPFWHSTGNMPQHCPYFPNARDYYYFHPYNAIHVAQQQEMVNRWGLDPRNPMDNRFFERIYQEQEAAQIQDTPQPLMPR